MDPEIVDHPAYRRVLEKGLLSIPTLSIVINKEDMFGPDGIYVTGKDIGGTMPASIELIYPHDLDSSFQVNCAIESHGEVSIKRSFRLKFKKEFGPAKLRSSIFQRAVLNGESATDTLDRIVLRSGGGRCFATGFAPDETAYSRDQWMRDTQIAMSGVGSHGIFVHLYINGLYWGLYNACERPDAWFNSSYFGGEAEDWFSVNHNGPRRGDPTRWDYLRGSLKDRDMRVPAYDEELRRYLDVERFCDYLILCWMVGLADWPFNNWFGGNRNEPPSPFMFFVWDAEKSWWNPEPPYPIRRPFLSSRSSNSGNIVGIWHSLRKNEDFMILFADRVYKHCFNEGALTERQSSARWRSLTGYVEDAVAAESARWGDMRESLGEPVRTRDGSFYREVDRVLEMMQGSVERFISALRSQHYYPRIDPPRFSHPGGAVSLDFALAVRNPNATGTIYYTTDGTDPRSPGGGRAIGTFIARTEKTVRIRETTTVRARVKGGETWSAIHEATFCVESFWERILRNLLPAASGGSPCP